MQVSTGATHQTINVALQAGVPADDLVEVRGAPEAVESVATAVPEVLFTLSSDTPVVASAASSELFRKDNLTARKVWSTFPSSKAS